MNFCNIFLSHSSHSASGIHHHRATTFCYLPLSPMFSAPSNHSTWGGGSLAPPPQTLQTPSPPTPQGSPPPSPPPPPLDGSMDVHLLGRTAVAGERHWKAPAEGRSLQGRSYSSRQRYYPSPPPSSPSPPPLPPSPPPRSSSLRREPQLFCNPCTGPFSSAVLDYAEAMTGLLLLAFVACLLVTCHKTPATNWLGTMLASMQRSSRGTGPAVPV